MPLHPSLLDHLRAANTPPAVETVRSLGDIAAGAVADFNNTDAGRERRRAASSLESITDREIRAAFETSFELSGKLADYIDLPTPTPEDLAEAGVDYAYLAGEYERMEAEGLEPRIVLVPHGLGLDNWRAIFSKATADSTIPNNPLKDPGDGAGLYVWDDAAALWHTFDKAPSHTTAPGQAELAHVTTTTHGGVGDTATWTIRIVPGTQTPHHLKKSYAQTVTEGIQHQTVPEMLTDKLTAIMLGQPPTDTTRWAWCDNGKLGAGSAPGGRWRVGDGQGRVVLADVDFSDDLLGSRSPVG